jgi:hypothetical protein
MLDYDDMKGGRPGGGSVGGGGGGGGGIGFENFSPGGGSGNPLDNLPNIPAMTGGNPGYAYPPPHVVSTVVTIIILLSHHFFLPSFYIFPDIYPAQWCI